MTNEKNADQSSSGAFMRAREMFQKALKERGLKGSDVLFEIAAERDTERLEQARKLRAIAEHEEADFIAGQEYLNAMIEGSDRIPSINELYSENKRLVEENAELRNQLELSVKITKALASDKRTPADNVSRYTLNEEQAQLILNTLPPKRCATEADKAEFQRAQEILASRRIKNGVVQLGRNNESDREWYENDGDYDV